MRERRRALQAAVIWTAALALSVATALLPRVAPSLPGLRDIAATGAVIFVALGACLAWRLDDGPEPGS